RVFPDTAGYLFFADSDTQRVHRTTSFTNNTEWYAGGRTAKADGVPANTVDLDYTTVFAFDRNGNLLIDSLSGIRRVDKSTRVISTLAVDFGISYGVVVDPSGNLLVSSDGYAAILKFTPASTTDFTIIAGEGNFVGDALPATAAIVRSPQGL